MIRVGQKPFGRICTFLLGQTLQIKKNQSTLPCLFRDVVLHVTDALQQFMRSYAPTLPLARKLADQVDKHSSIFPFT